MFSVKISGDQLRIVNEAIKSVEKVESINHELDKKVSNVNWYGDTAINFQASFSRYYQASTNTNYNVKSALNIIREYIEQQLEGEECIKSQNSESFGSSTIKIMDTKKISSTSTKTVNKSTKSVSKSKKSYKFNKTKKSGKVYNKTSICTSCKKFKDIDKKCYNNTCGTNIKVNEKYVCKPLLPTVKKGRFTGYSFQDQGVDKDFVLAFEEMTSINKRDDFYSLDLGDRIKYRDAQLAFFKKYKNYMYSNYQDYSIKAKDARGNPVVINFRKCLPFDVLTSAGDTLPSYAYLVDVKK